MAALALEHRPQRRPTHSPLPLRELRISTQHFGSQAPELAPRKTREFSKSKFGLRVHAACEIKCNGSWMSDLEVKAKPLITPAIQGRPIFLTTIDQQRTVASWGLKTAMMVNCARPGGAQGLVPPEHYQAHKKKEPPRSIYVWQLPTSVFPIGRGELPGSIPGREASTPTRATPRERIHLQRRSPCISSIGLPLCRGSYG